MYLDGLMYDRKPRETKLRSRHQTETLAWVFSDNSVSTFFRVKLQKKCVFSTIERQNFDVETNGTPFFLSYVEYIYESNTHKKKRTKYQPYYNSFKCTVKARYTQSRRTLRVHTALHTHTFSKSITRSAHLSNSYIQQNHFRNIKDSFCCGP